MIMQRKTTSVLACALATTLALAAPRPAGAGSTDPVLAIGQATATEIAGALRLDVSGTWQFDDVLQVTFPLNVLVSQGSTFVRFPVGGTPESGTMEGLADGLDVGEIASLEASGAPDADAELVRIGAHEMALAVPPVFAAAPVRVVLYVELPAEGSFLSNAVATPILEVAP